MGTAKRSARSRGKYHPQIYADEMQAAINGNSEKISENQREILPADLRR
ncbi:hypothetical protein [Niabella aurantiaca]|nr:hypothetical protein [Niabella aurantiaca]